MNSAVCMIINLLFDEIVYGRQAVNTTRMSVKFAICLGMFGTFTQMVTLFGDLDSGLEALGLIVRGRIAVTSLRCHWVPSPPTGRSSGQPRCICRAVCVFGGEPPQLRSCQQNMLTHDPPEHSWIPCCRGGRGAWRVDACGSVFVI